MIHHTAFFEYDVYNEFNILACHRNYPPNDQHDHSRTKPKILLKITVKMRKAYQISKRSNKTTYNKETG